MATAVAVEHPQDVKAREDGPAIIVEDGATGAGQEEYIKEEQRSLKNELLRAQEEVKRIQAVPLVIGQFLEMVDNRRAGGGLVVVVVAVVWMDGFEQNTNVKVIMATNRADTLDPALLRPGRLDRKIEFPLPDRRQKRLVFQACTSKMNLSEEVDLEDYVARPDRINNAEEAGMLAVRKNRYVILPKDFEKAYKNVVRKQADAFEFYT
eukprot:scaffold2.g7104.t1